jgi:hypothetical protein
MPNSIEIREMEDRDLEQVIELWQAAGVLRPWNDPLKDVAFARRGPHSTILVATIDDAVVATSMAIAAGFTTSPPTPNFKAPVWVARS